MKEVLEIFIASFWLFGALWFWPLFRFWLKSDSYGVKLLKWQFWITAFGLIFGFSLTYYYYLIGNRDWLHSLILPYGVGAVSWVAAILILMGMGIISKRS